MERNVQHLPDKDVETAEEYYYLKLLWLACIILFFRLDDHGLLLRNLLDISPPTVCSNLRSAPWHSY